MDSWQDLEHLQSFPVVFIHPHHFVLLFFFSKMHDNVSYGKWVDRENTVFILAKVLCNTVGPIILRRTTFETLFSEIGYRLQLNKSSFLIHVQKWVQSKLFRMQHWSNIYVYLFGGNSSQSHSVILASFAIKRTGTSLKWLISQLKSNRTSIPGMDTAQSTPLSCRVLIFSKRPTLLQNLIWEWHLGSPLSSSSHRTSVHTSSPLRHWAGIRSSARPPLWLLALFIAPASNRCLCDPDTPAPAHTVSPTFLAALPALLYPTPPPISLASGVSKPLCMSVLKGGSYHRTCSSLASGERQQSWFLTLPASQQPSLGTTYQFLFFVFHFFPLNVNSWGSEKRHFCSHQITAAMKWSWVFLGVFLSLGTLSWGEKGLEVPEYDGKDRVHDLSAKNYKSIMKKYDVMVIYYHKNVDGNRSAMKQFQIEELALEVGVHQSMTVDGYEARDGGELMVGKEEGRWGSHVDHLAQLGHSTKDVDGDWKDGFHFFVLRIFFLCLTFIPQLWFSHSLSQYQPTVMKKVMKTLGAFSLIW